MALSTKMPVGLPAASRWIAAIGLPRPGQVALHRTHRWYSPSRHGRRCAARPGGPGTRRPGRPAREDFSGQSFWSQPRPINHSPGFNAAALARRRSRISALSRVSTRSASIIAKPSPLTCACASIRPGTTVALPRSSRRACRPARQQVAAVSPTAGSSPRRRRPSPARAAWPCPWCGCRAALSTVVCASAGNASGPATIAAIVRSFCACRPLLRHEACDSTQRGDECDCRQVQPLAGSARSPRPHQYRGEREQRQRAGPAPQGPRTRSRMPRISRRKWVSGSGSASHCTGFGMPANGNMKPGQQDRRQEGEETHLHGLEHASEIISPIARLATISSREATEASSRLPRSGTWNSQAPSSTRSPAPGRSRRRAAPCRS